MNIREFFLSSAWWGKLLGAFFGFLIAGPVGAFVGIMIGNFFDRGFALHLANPLWAYLNERNLAAKRRFFEATFLVMGYIAKADGRVSEAEIAIARQLMDEMRLSRKDKLEAKQLFSRGKSANFIMEPVLTAVYQSCFHNQDLLKLFINIQYRAAQTDGLCAKKVEALNLLLTQLGFAPLTKQKRFVDDFAWYTQEQNYRSAQRPYTSSSTTQLSQAYALLDVNQNATKIEVKKAYRQLLSRNHPDKVIAKGLPEAAIKEANEKTQQIRKAYELICSSKGWQY